MAQVRPGDTLCAVARRHGLGLGELLDRNPGYRSAPGAVLRVGAQLRVPLRRAAPGSAARQGRVTVGPGDTLFRLSESNGVPVAAIAQANGLASSTIRLGASLVLPAAAHSHGSKLGARALPALPSRRTHRRLYGSGLQAATAIGGEARDAAVALFGRAHPRLHFSARAKNKLREAGPGLPRVPTPAAAEAAGRSLAQAVASGLRRRFSGFRHPVPDGVLTSRFGMRWGRMHEGVDVAAPTGTSVSASRAGEVTYRSYEAGGYGGYTQPHRTRSLGLTRCQIRKHPRDRSQGRLQNPLCPLRTDAAGGHGGGAGGGRATNRDRRQHGDVHGTPPPLRGPQRALGGRPRAFRPLRAVRPWGRGGGRNREQKNRRARTTRNAPSSAA